MIPSPVNPASCIRALAACALAAASFVTTAQTFPSRPVTIIVPYAPGGANDVVSRVIATHLTTATGTSYVVDNRPGAYGNIGAGILAKSRPDGYTIGYLNAIHAVNNSFFKSVPFDLENDFIPLAEIGYSHVMFVMRPDAPFRTIPELIAYAKANPGKLNYGSAGSAHPIEMLKALTGLQVTTVPYKGFAPALADLFGKRLDFLAGVNLDLMPHIRTGKVRPLAMTGTTRYKELPDVPTVAETIPGFDSPQWYGFFVPVKTPNDAVEVLRTELLRARSNPAVTERLTAQGMDISPRGMEEFRRNLREDIGRWRDIARKGNIQYE